MPTVTIHGARFAVHPTRAERVPGPVRDLDVLRPLVPVASLRDAVPGPSYDEEAR